MLGKTITIIGFSLIFMYVISQILNFYGIGTSIYGNYMVFYLFIIISLLVLPTAYPTLNKFSIPSSLSSKLI